MDQETQQYYDNYFTLFSTDGWKQLTEENHQTHLSLIHI